MAVETVQLLRRRRMRIGSLCTGYGGLDIAASAHFQAQVVWHAEFDRHAAAVADRHWPGTPNHGDITTIDWAAVEPVDILVGGYPCQPFSIAGHRRGSDDDRHIWPYIADAIRVLRPRVAVFENVSNHLRIGFASVLADLAALGFDARWGIVRAADVGAPHTRQRLFVVATASDTAREHEVEVSAATDRRTHTVPGERVAAADTDGRRHGSRQNGRGLGCVDGADEEDPQQRQRARPQPGDRSIDVDFGPYTSAVRRWEATIGRPAPDPAIIVNGRRRLNTRFVEWMMGLPDGWVCDTPGIPLTQQLKILGNGVVPQQAALALAMLT